MVEINRPDGKVEIGHSGVDSQAITEEAIAADSGIAEESSLPPGAEGFLGTDSVPPESTDGLAGAMHPDWQSAKTQKSRQIALVVALAATGLITAVLFFGWFVSSWGQREVKPTDGVAFKGGDSSTQNSDGGNQQTNPANSEVSDMEVTQNQTAPQESDVLESSVPDNAGSAEPDSDLENPPGTDPPVEAEPGGTSAASSSDVAVSDTGTASEIPSDLLQPPVLGSVDGQDSTVSTDNENAGAVQADEGDLLAPEPNEAVDDAGGMQDLPPELAQYTQFLLDDGAQSKPTLQAPPTMEQVKLDEAAVEEDEDLLIQVVPKELDLRADLAIKLALASDGYPASDLMLLISQVTGVPIQMDWPSYDLAGADMQQTIPTTKQWRSARELLDEAAGLLNSEIQEQPTLLLLTLRDDVFEEAASMLTSVDDFGAGGDTARDFLTRFLAGDQGDANPRQLRQLACFATEALRRMRGVDPKMEEARFRRWACQVSDPDADWDVLSGGKFGPAWDTPVSVAGLLRRTARLNQATCVFNWHDAVRRGAPPEFLLLPHKQEDAGKTLQHTLAPSGLQVRQVDSEHWWVGTEATYDRLPIFVWTPPLNQTREDFVERMNQVMAGVSTFKYRMAIDEVSNRALLLLPRFIVRQLPTVMPEFAAK